MVTSGRKAKSTGGKKEALRPRKNKSVQKNAKFVGNINH
jgi:hypothetical protein